MKPPIFVRELSEKERERLEAGLRSKDAFVMRRLPYGCEIAPSGALQDPRHLESVGRGYTAALWRPLVKLCGDEALEHLHKQPARHHTLCEEDLEGCRVLSGYLLSHESEPRL